MATEGVSDKPRSINYGYLFGYLSVILIGSIHFGFNISIFGSCLRLFKTMYFWDKDEEAFWSAIVTTLVPAGAMVTSLLSNQIMVYGRRITIFIGAGFTILATFFMSVIHTPDADHPNKGLVFFCFGRILLGFSVGLYSSVTPTYINEIAPKHLTGAFGSCHQLLLTFAIVISYFIGLVLPEGDPEALANSFSWRIAMAVPAFLVIIQVIAMLTCFKFDSPSFYAQTRDIEMLKASVRCFYSEEAEVDEKVDELKATGEKSLLASSSGSLYSQYKLAFWIGIIIPMIQQLTGINIVVFYAPIIFKEQGEERAKMLSLGFSLINFVSTFGSVFLADKLGRRLLLLLGSIGCGLMLLLCFFTVGGHSDGMHWIFNIGVYLFILVFGMSHGPVCWLYISEILFPSWMGYGTASSWGFTILVSLSTPFLFNSLSQWTYFLYFCFMIASTVFCFIFVKETKGKNRDEIMNDFSSRSEKAQIGLMSQNQHQSLSLGHYWVYTVQLL